MTERVGNWSQTFTGRRFWPLDPRPDDFCVEDIAHALALQCRFAGHCRVPYSVAEHSVRVSLYAEERLRHYHPHGPEVVRQFSLAALLHDASEAYCVDVPRPLKPYIQGYAEIEGAVQIAIEQWADIPRGSIGNSLIKHADEVLLATEARDLMVITSPWHLRAEPLAEALMPWKWETAEHEFLTRFVELGGRRG